MIAQSVAMNIDVTVVGTNRVAHCVVDNAHCAIVATAGVAQVKEVVVVVTVVAGDHIVCCA